MNIEDTLAKAGETSRPSAERAALYRSVMEHAKAKKAIRADAGVKGLVLEFELARESEGDDLIPRTLEVLGLLKKKDRDAAWKLCYPAFPYVERLGLRDDAVALFLKFTDFAITKSSIPGDAVARVPSFLDDPRLQALLAPKPPKKLLPHKEALERTLLPRRCFSGRSSHTPSPQANVLGGEPGLSTGMEWPRDSKGQPMHFLARLQLDNFRFPGWPREGRLLFFVSDEAARCLRGECRVLHSGGIHNVDSKPVQAEVEKLFGGPLVKTPGTFHLHSYLQPMSGCDYRFDQVAPGIDAKTKKKWTDKHSPLPVKNQVGGYPYFTQDEDQRRATDDPETDVLLLQIDSDPQFGLSWGDNGIVQFFVPASDLAKGDFTRVRFLGDCL